VRRPKDKDPVITRLQEDGVLKEIRDVIAFAAALGFSLGRRVPFTEAGEPIRWETFTNRRGSEALVNMIAAASIADTDDIEILSPSRFSDRVLIFEEYANGGLIELEQRLAGVRTNSEVVLGLVQEELAQPEDRDELEKLLFGSGS
jgi:dnd system-associated protein 4